MKRKFKHARLNAKPSEIAAWIFPPDVAGGRLTARTEVAAADIYPTAAAATSLHEIFLVPQLVEQRPARRVSPDLRKRALPHVAYGMVPPELIGIHRTVPRNAGDANAARIAAVEFE